MLIRSLQNSDVAMILVVYKRAFAGYPWFENLSEEVISNRWKDSSSQPEFRCIVGEESQLIVAAVWWNTLTEKNLIRERGQPLFDFVKSHHSGYRMIWEREVMVDPDFQGRGIATIMRQKFIEQVCATHLPSIVLTRMRDDNFGIIKIAQKLGYIRTGIRMPCTLKPGVCHEYWHIDLK